MIGFASRVPPGFLVGISERGCFKIRGCKTSDKSFWYKVPLTSFALFLPLAPGPAQLALASLILISSVAVLLRRRHLEPISEALPALLE